MRGSAPEFGVVAVDFERGLIVAVDVEGVDVGPRVALQLLEPQPRRHRVLIEGLELFVEPLAYLGRQLPAVPLEAGFEGYLRNA